MSQALKIPSNRSFGFTFAGVFAVVGAWMIWRANRLGLPALGVSALFAIIAVTLPRILHPLNVAWMHFGLLLSKIVSPIVLGAIFFVLFTPVGLLFRVIKRDALHRAFDRDQRSYWIDRSPPGPDGKTSFPRQF